jgi:hypothetical protein
MNPFDLHVLSTPPAFVLSQDQTLRREHEPTRRLTTNFWFVVQAEPLLGGPGQNNPTPKSGGTSIDKTFSTLRWRTPALAFFCPLFCFQGAFRLVAHALGGGAWLVSAAMGCPEREITYTPWRGRASPLNRSRRRGRWFSLFERAGNAR